MTLIQSFAKVLKSKNAHYHPNDIPFGPIALGDFGILKNGIFYRQGNIKELGIECSFVSIPCNISINASLDSHFSSSVEGEGEIKSLINCNIELSFQKRNAYYFNVILTKQNYYQSIHSLEKQIMVKFKAGEWKAKYVIVTNLFESENVLLAMAENSGGTLKLNCKTTQYNENLTGAKAAFSILSNDCSATTCLSTDYPVVPLFELYKIKGLFPKFGPIASYGTMDTVINNEDFYSSEIKYTFTKV